jgi:small subunit ribosomal protein S6
VRRYETIFILRPNLGEIQLKQSLKRVEDIVANGGGDLIETDEWGMRELAYRIKRERRGYYVRLDYVATGAVMNEVERNLKLMDESLRHLSVMVEEDADAAHLRSEVEARQRRLAEARSAASGETPKSEEQPAAPEGEPIREGAAAEPPQSAEPAASETPAEQPDPSTEAADGTEQN